MTGKEIIQAVLNGKPQQGWAVFRLNALSVIMTLIGWAVIDALFIAGAIVLLQNYPSQPNNKMLLYMGIFLAVMALLFFIPVFNRLRALLFARGSMVVLTPECVVRNYSGKLLEVPHTDVTQLKIVWQTGNGFPQHYVEFVDRRTNAYIELARNRTFGRAETIYNHLQEKFLWKSSNT